MSSEDHWKERESNPSESLLNTAESQVFGFFWGAYIAYWLLCSLLCSFKTLRSRTAPNFCSLAQKARFTVLNSASPHKLSPLGRQLSCLVYTKWLLTFSIREKSNLFTGNGRNSIVCKTCHVPGRWEGMAIRDLVTWTQSAPPARAADGTAREQLQGVQKRLFSATDGHANTHSEKLSEFIPNKNTIWEQQHKCKNDAVTCKLSCIFHPFLYLIRQPRRYRCKANRCCVYLHLEGQWEVTRKVKLFLLEYL